MFNLKTGLLGVAAVLTLTAGLHIVLSHLGKPGAAPSAEDIVVNTGSLPTEATHIFPVLPVNEKRVIKGTTINFKRAVTLYSEVNGGSVAQAIHDINALLKLDPKEPIWLLLASPGGSVFDGEMLLSAIESSSAPIYTVNTFICASMCAIIHQYGTKRYSFDRATLMFHDAACGVQGDVRRMQSMLDFISRKIEKADRYIAKRSGLTYEQFMQLHADELWIDAQDALSKGLLDGVIKSQMDTDSSDAQSLASEKLKHESVKLKDGFIPKIGM